MPAIAILDDRKSDRETIERVVVSTLKALKENPNWNVVSDDPPSVVRDVFQWLDEHDATVLITDWKLNEGSKDKRVVNYEADKLIQEIRAKRPSFPIFVITGFKSEAKTHLKEVENILSREEFISSASTVLPQMLRAGLRRYDMQRDLLTTMDALARQVASGQASSGDRRKLRSLQGYFQTDIPGIIDLDSALGELETAKKKADALRKKIEARIGATKEKK